MDGISPTSGKPRKVRFHEQHTVYIIPNEEPEGIDPNVVKIDGVPLVARRGVFTSNLQPGDYQVPLKGVGADVKGNVHEGVSNSDTHSSGDAKPGIGHGSYADKVQVSSSKDRVNFRYLESLDKHPGCEGVDVVLPRDSVKQVQSKLAFTLYGYFLGDRVAYPVVDYFVRLNWKKFGLQKTMMNANGFFFFKFADHKGMMDVLEGGPWLIRNKPIFLNTWSPTTTLLKEDIKNAAVWVKLHNVPLAAYTDVGLSMIASKIGSPKMLDSYTSAMCSDAWGRSSYARALIELSADHDFKEEISLAIPEMDGEEYVTVSVGVEYEWKPPRCAHCCVFGHDSDGCPKRVDSTSKSTPSTPKVVVGDGFTEVKSKKSAKKTGVPVNNQKPRFEFRPIDYKKMMGGGKPSSGKGKAIKTQNSFSALGSARKGDSGFGSSKEMNNDDGYDEEEVGVFYDESKYPEASTSPSVVSNG